jgi:3-isopropylmalate/(R)-2-methylmalate dehydratase large subunit
MPGTIIEKILSNHADKLLKPGDIADIRIDVRAARDFGGANVVNHIKNNNLTIADPLKTYFTFDCNPCGSDQQFAANQQICRQFAREQGIKVYDVNQGIGSHVVIEEGLVHPGDTFVSTDSHANILGAIGALGQGMGDQDIAAAFNSGSIWFQVPKTMKLILKGIPPKNTSAKDIVLKLLKEFGADGLLGYAVEVCGNVVDKLNLSARVTIASMVTEMAGIIMLFPPDNNIIQFCREAGGNDFESVYADKYADYEITTEIDISNLDPMISRPGHPEDVISVHEAAGTKIDSAFIGSCTNSRFEDMLAAAEILKNRKLAPGVILKIVPSTRKVWERCLSEGLIDIFIKSGAVVGNPGCAGCAVGQMGQNGPGEVTISTGNRNYTGKQGKGDVYLASPATVAASAAAGVITSADKIPEKPVSFNVPKSVPGILRQKRNEDKIEKEKSLVMRGRIWVIRIDNIDTDTIFHNRYLAVTEQSEMGQYTFDNLEELKDFSKKAKPGDMIVTGSNFGSGSSRQQAVDCFMNLGIQAIIAKSFGAIYERNAINAGLPVIKSNIIDTDIESGEEITVDLKKGSLYRHKTGETIKTSPFSDIQMKIYQRGGLLNI